MNKVKLEETKDRRRLHIGSYFVDLNETEYQELINIFGKKAKNISSNMPVIGSVCDAAIMPYCVDFMNNGCCGRCGKEIKQTVI